MRLEGLHMWHRPDQLLDQLNTHPPESKQQNDQMCEAKVIAQFARLVFPGERCQVRLYEGQFPDAEIMITESGYIKPVEITQAFEGGDNSPSRKSRLILDDAQQQFRNFNFYKMTEYEFMRGLHLAIQRKVDKNYALRPHLLVYVSNIPTWGEAARFIEAHEDEFEQYRPFFSSLNVLTQNAEHAIQILPKIKLFHRKLH